MLGERGARELGRRLALVEDDDAVAQRRRARRCRSSRSAPARPPPRVGADERVHLGLRADVDAARRVVEQHHRGLRVEPLGEHDLLLVAARQRARGVVDRPRADAQPARPELAARSRRRPARTTGPSEASPTERTWPMFSQIGLSSISPSRRRSPETSATPARDRAPQAVRHGTAAGQRRPSRRPGAPEPADSSSTAWWPAPATPASPTTSPGATRQRSAASSDALDGGVAQLQRRPRSVEPEGLAERARGSGSAPGLGASTGSPSIALTITGTVSFSRGSALIAVCPSRSTVISSHRRHHVLEDVRDEHDADVAVAQHPQRVEQHLRARRAERRRRLVEDQHARLGEQRLGDLQQLALGEAEVLDRRPQRRRRDRDRAAPAALAPPSRALEIRTAPA